MTIEQDEDTLAASIAEERGGGEPEADEPDTEVEETEEEGDEPEAEETETEEEPEGEAEEEETEDDQEPEQRTRGRGSARIQRLQRELAEERRQRQELERRTSGQPGNSQPPAFDPQAAQKAITEELAKDFDQFEFKTKEQRAEIFLRAQQKVLQPFMRSVAGTMAGDRDKSAFRENCSKEPFFEKLAPKVEAEFQKAQSQGYFIPREQFYNQMVAELARKGALKTGGSQKRAANIRKQKAAGQPTGTKGDAGGARGRGTRLQQLEGRLKDLKI